jgi:putative CocE/NonD family hydrolase
MIDQVSPHNYISQLQNSGAAIYNYSGWFDGAYQLSAIKRFLTLENTGSRLIIGPWAHGGHWNMDPCRKTPKAIFDHDGELLRFFDLQLKGIDSGIKQEKRVAYYTMCRGEWRFSDQWPPAGIRDVRYYAANEGQLLNTTPKFGKLFDRYNVDPTTGTTAHSRWNTLLNINNQDLAYGDRQNEDKKLLLYTSKPLDRDQEVTGHPLARLYVSSSEQDGGDFFVYLEDVAPNGNVKYVTEGELSAVHRAVSSNPPYQSPVAYRTFHRQDVLQLSVGAIAQLDIDLLPTSYVFRRGHRIRMAIAGVDKDHFGRPLTPRTINLFRSNAYASFLQLPLMDP